MTMSVHVFLSMLEPPCSPLWSFVLSLLLLPKFDISSTTKWSRHIIYSHLNFHFPLLSLKEMVRLLPIRLNSPAFAFKVSASNYFCICNGSVVRRAHSTAPMLLNLIDFFDCPASEPLSKSIFIRISLTVGPELKFVDRFVGLHGVSPQPHPRKKSNCSN